MILDERRIIDQLLASEEPCLGAVFCSYTFDPAYFEDHVLRALLRLHGDPAENPLAYYEEALRALQETPVACFVDAAVRNGGQRLPYDVHLVRKRTFHPKVFLALYEAEAHLAVGSGNVTKSGLEQNTELFFFRRLRYDQPAEAVVLREVHAFFENCASLAGRTGSQLDLALTTLRNRLRDVPDPAPSQRADVQFVTSFPGRLLDHLRDAIPVEAKITRVGMLAPFFEQDDLDAGATDDGIHSVLADLLAMRSSTGASLDIGVPWDDAPLAASASAPPLVLDTTAAGLCAWRKREKAGDETVERMEYFAIDAVTERRVQATNSAGVACRFDRDTLNVEIAAQRLWLVTRPIVHAPKTILGRIAADRPVQLWLHPSWTLSPSGHPRRRPLHAKVVLVTAESRGRAFTYAMVGSANASKGALGRGVAQAGNVEAGVLCRFDGTVSLRDLLPSLVAYSIDSVEFIERPPVANGIDLSAWIDEVVHDAAAHSLTVSWHPTGPAPLGPWRLRYVDRDILSGDGAPGAPCHVDPFALLPTSAELTLVAGAGEWQIPIRVLDLAQLPVNDSLASLGLRDLLALLGRRIGSERLATLHAQRGVGGVDAVLDALFGEDFGPTDVFKAWWGAADDLKGATGIAPFRHRLVGPTGIQAAWSQLSKLTEERLSRDEVWVYGCELHRDLSTIDLPPGADFDTKQGLLRDFLDGLKADLLALAPAPNGRAWLEAVSTFYGTRGNNA